MPVCVRGQEVTAQVPAIAGVNVMRHPREEHLTRGKPFHGDVRTLPQVPPTKFERPEFEEPKVTPVPYPGAAVAQGGMATSAAAANLNAPAPSPSSSFDGLDFANWGAGHPPDPNGDVGPQHYIQTINTSVGIYRKNGVRLAAFTFDTLMSQGSFGNLCDTDNFGDPVVLYDTFEDRWIITDFAFKLDGSGNIIAPSYQCLAVSKSGDPVAGGWNFYSISSTSGFGDYPKFAIWPDGLYMSANMFGFGAGGSFQNVRVWAFNKAQMYAGEPTVQILSFDAPSAEFTLLPSNARLQTGTPPAGSPNYFAVVWQFLNAVSVYKFQVNWASASTSTFSGPFTSLTSTWWAQYLNSNATSVPSPANRLDSLYPRLMVQNQYTNLGGVESLWTSHTVGAGNPTSNVTSAQAAVRFYQVKVTGGNVEASATQSFTYSPDSTVFRFMPSVDVDRAGDMAIGYSASDAALNPAIRYAGRLAGDPVNSITQTEQSLIEGAGSQSGNCGSSSCIRWGDYSAMTLDVDGCTFWYTNEYYQTTGLNFNTRVGTFSLPGCTPVATGTLQGTVSALASGNPISGATVELGSRTATTDVNGNYNFTGLASGVYPSVTASSPGYNSTTVTNIVVSDGAITTQNFSLTLAPTSGCFTDTTQADFQAGVPTNCDLTSSPGDVILVNTASIDQQNTTLGNSGVGITTTTWGGQTFTPAVTGRLTRADINLFCSGCTGTTPNLTLSVRATSGGLPTGADLASATITGFSNGSAVFYTATFSSPATLTSGTQYALVIRPTANPSAGTYALTRSGTSTAGADVYPGGARVSGASSGTAWSSPTTGGVTTDAGFKTYMQAGFASSGTFVSSTKDANPAPGANVNWSTLSWTADTPAGTAIQFQVAASNNADGPFNFVGPDGTAGTFFTNGGSLAQFTGQRYLKYQASLSTTSGAV
ncbi:MAG: carboxypeptidase-like regulatory domain-containing protein, partial [Terriglobales bacterium]